MNRNIEIRNDLWQATVSGSSGDVIQLLDVRQQAERVLAKPLKADTVLEGGLHRPPGLSLWVKTGNEPDHNTAVLSEFAAVHNAPRTFRVNASEVVAEAEAGGMRLTLALSLPAGPHPLRLKASVENRGASPVPCQLECFYQWHLTKREQTAYSLPGLPPKRLLPFGQLYYQAGEGTSTPAMWWQVGTDQGIVMRAVRGVLKYFVGVQKPMFVLGPHSELHQLAPGSSMTMELEVAPLWWATQQGWNPGCGAEEHALQVEDRHRTEVAVRLGDVAHWCRKDPPAIRRRVIHLTAQYSASGMDDMLRLVERVLAPAGFNEIVLEVDRNFRYRSHPGVSPDWAWDAKAWKSAVQQVRSMGFNVVPQYNALGHQGESALATAYPELSEDAGNWCLNPEHPKTLPYLCDLFRELIDVFEPRQFHVGLDEIDVPSRQPTFALSKPGRTRDGGDLLALHINGLHDYLKGQGLEMWMWADMLLYRPEHRIQHGLRPGTWKAIDRISRDILIVDWIYHKVPDFGGSLYLQEKGFRVMGATWHTPGNIRDWAQFAVAHSMEGMMHTTWTLPTMQDVNMVCTLLAGRYFQDPDAPSADQLIPEAEALGLALVNA